MTCPTGTVEDSVNDRLQDLTQLRGTTRLFVLPGTYGRVCDLSTPSLYGKLGDGPPVVLCSGWVFPSWEPEDSLSRIGVNKEEKFYLDEALRAGEESNLV